MGWKWKTVTKYHNFKSLPIVIKGKIFPNSSENPKLSHELNNTYWVLGVFFRASKDYYSRGEQLSHPTKPNHHQSSIPVLDTYITRMWTHEGKALQFLSVFWTSLDCHYWNKINSFFLKYFPLIRGSDPQLSKNSLAVIVTCCHNGPVAFHVEIRGGLNSFYSVEDWGFGWSSSLTFSCHTHRSDLHQSLFFSPLSQ